MTRDRLVTVFVVLVAAAVGVVVWAFVLHPSRVVHDRPVVTTPIVSSPLTPLRDSGPKNNARTSTTREIRPSNSSRTPGSLNSAPQAAPQNRPRPSRKRKGPKTTPTPRPSSQDSPQPSQPSSPQPSQPPPVVGVTAPAPVTVCARPVATVNC